MNTHSPNDITMSPLSVSLEERLSEIARVVIDLQGQAVEPQEAENEKNGSTMKAIWDRLVVENDLFPGIPRSSS